MTKTKNGYQISFLIVLIMVVLSFCICVGSVVAWLKYDYSNTSKGLKLGSVTLALYNGSTEIIGASDTEGVPAHATVEIPESGSTSRTLGIKVRNTGTIDCLVRATFNIYYLEDDGNRVTLVKNISYTSYDHSDWVAKTPEESTAMGYLFYNDKLSPYVKSTIDNNGNISTSTVENNAKTIISSITTTEALKTKKLYIDISVDGIAYSGNIYKKIENNETSASDIPVHAYPFGTKDELPIDWIAWK